LQTQIILSNLTVALVTFGASNNPICMKNVVQTANRSHSLQAVKPSGHQLPYTGMYVQMNLRKHHAKISPFKSLFQTAPAVKEVTSWDAEWFGNYE